MMLRSKHKSAQLTLGVLAGSAAMVLSLAAHAIDKADADTQIHLKTGRLIPVDNATPRWSSAQPTLKLVQFKQNLSASLRNSVENAGGQIISFIPDNTLLIRADAMTSQKIQKLSTVRWMTPYLADFKHGNDVGAKLGSWSAVPSQYDLSIATPSDRTVLVRKLELDGVRDIKAHAGATFIVASLNPVQLKKALTYQEVLWVEQTPELELDIDKARIQGGADELESQVTAPGYTGVGIIGHVMEGANPDHQDFAANEYREKPIGVADPSYAGHGQATFGIIFGSGAGREDARGLLPNAQGLFTSYNYVFGAEAGSTGEKSRYALVKKLVEEHKVMFQTASWGYSRNTEYTARSMEMDKLIFDHDIPITQSQSNAGNRASRPQAWAKNIISVGAVLHKGTADPSDDEWKQTASIGPATDGRMKPDVAAYYDKILTTSKEGYTEGFGGTSGATPIVAGHVGLILEMYTDGIFGNELKHGKEKRFENRSHFSTTKALLINGAEQYEFEGLEHDLTRAHQGWGFPNVINLYNRKDKTLIVDEAKVLKAEESAMYEVVVAEGETDDFKATLVYADPAPAASAAKQRVNDINLKVTAPDGTIYWGNNGLAENMYSMPGGEANDLDTVENVFVQNPEAGTWKVEVIAAEVNVDAHKETDADDVDFALVISGIKK